MRVEVVLATPRCHEVAEVALPPGATVADALAGCGLRLEGIAGYAVFGLRVQPSTILNEGDRLELLRPLALDPKEARRRRALRSG